MTERFDVVVVGGGPGGLMAAREAAKRGARVLLLEKDPAIGQPVHCGEGVTRHTFDDFIKIRPGWIRSNPKIGRIYSPSGSSFAISHAFGGYILDRPKMEQDLADDVRSYGGVVRCGWRGVSLQRSPDGFSELHAIDAEGVDVQIAGRVFIAADGIESAMARNAGIGVGIVLTSTESYLEYRLSGIEVDVESIEIYLGEEIAPRSYAWVFPVSSSEANVGLGIPSEYGPSRPARDSLDRFIARRWGKATIDRTSCGAAFRYQGPNKLAKDNLLVVGDAARLMDSLSGAGIQTAMASGKLAGEAAARLLLGELSSIAEMHRVYPSAFIDAHDPELTQMLKLKEFVARLDDSELDDLVGGLAEVLGEGPVASIDAWPTLLGVIRKRPRILRIARHLFF